jgi:hypothetical protein
MFGLARSSTPCDGAVAAAFANQSRGGMSGPIWHQDHPLSAFVSFAYDCPPYVDTVHTLTRCSAICAPAAADTSRCHPYIFTDIMLTCHRCTQPAHSLPRLASGLKTWSDMLRP